MGFEFSLDSINRSIFILFLLSAVYTVSLFIAPMTLEPGTVQGLDGNANMVDYRERWGDMSPYHEAIYLFSDFNCHQKHYRSYTINQNQMPVCARDTGIFIGLTFGFLLMCFIRSRVDYKDILLDMIPIDSGFVQHHKEIILIILGVAFVLPLILDGGIDRKSVV